MIYTKQTKNAMKLAFEKHKNQIDKSGLPYIFHPFHLAEQMDDELSTTVALLHDVVEDTDVTFNDLSQMGFSEDVIDTLKYLTHNKSIPYMDYIKHISENKTATKVKIADLKHNSDLNRLNKITDKDLERVKKYRESIEYLENKH